MRILRLCLLLTLLAVVGACGSDDTSTATNSDVDPSSSSTSSSDASATTATTDGSTSTTDTGPTASQSTDRDDGDGVTGTVNVSLETIDGYFIEGFEVGLRFETTSRQVIDAILWTDAVAALGDPSIDDYYDAVHSQPVPPGEVVVLATVSIGAGPAPVVPDLDGPMQCELVVDVPPGGEVDVEVSFDQNECLTEL